MVRIFNGKGKRFGERRLCWMDWGKVSLVGIRCEREVSVENIIASANGQRDYSVNSLVASGNIHCKTGQA